MKSTSHSAGPDLPTESLPSDPDALLTEAQAGSFLNLSVRTLQAWRLRGGGPCYVKCGRAVRYRRRNLVEWMDANTTTSTSASR